MDPLGIVVHDEQTFLSKVVELGMERGLFTRDKTDEIIRVSVAMANKYVLHKEVDFRSTDELAKVQQTILKLVGIGLEIRSGGSLSEGLNVLMDTSLVELFRLAHTRLEKLRYRWARLLQDHRVEVLVSAEEYDCLDDFTCRRLSEMSVFTETEIDTIRSLKLEDDMFSSFGLVEYYEAELERYELILKLREIFPFELLNRSTQMRADNLAEVDSLREAFVHTLIVSTYLETPDPVTVTMAEVRRFTADLGASGESDYFPPEVEQVLLDLIEELGENLEEREAELLTKEMIRIAQTFIETILLEWDTVTSQNQDVFFKRWCRLVVLADTPDPLESMIAADEKPDELVFQQLLTHLANRPHEEAGRIGTSLPWDKLDPDQTIRLFQDLHELQPYFAQSVVLEGFSAAEIVDFVEVLETDIFPVVKQRLMEAAGAVEFGMEDLELLAGMPYKGMADILKASRPPSDYEPTDLIAELGDFSSRARNILMLTCWGEDFYPDLVREAWLDDPAFVKAFIKKHVPNEQIGPFLEAASQRAPVVSKRKKGDEPDLEIDGLDALFQALPVTKKRAAVKYFSRK